MTGSLGCVVVGEAVVQLEHVRRTFGDVVGLADLTLVAPKGSVTVPRKMPVSAAKVGIVRNIRKSSRALGRVVLSVIFIINVNIKFSSLYG